MRVGLSRYAGFTLAACFVLSGCKGKENAADTTATGMGATAGDTTAMAGGTTGMANTADTTAGKLSDANIAALVDEVNVGDSTLAAAALPKLTSMDAKNFAKLMMGEHHAAHVQGMQVEKQANITPQMPANDPFKPAVEAEQSALSSMAKGPAYDSTYIAHEVGIHQAVIAWAGKNTPQSAAYQQYLKVAGPIYQKHLDRALAIQKRMETTRS